MDGWLPWRSRKRRGSVNDLGLRWLGDFLVGIHGIRSLGSGGPPSDSGFLVVRKEVHGVMRMVTANPCAIRVGTPLVGLSGIGRKDGNRSRSVILITRGRNTFFQWRGIISSFVDGGIQ